jgi:hypothetical protein
MHNDMHTLLIVRSSVRRLGLPQGLEELCAASMAAVKRCVQGCGGVEMEGVLRSLDERFSSYFQGASAAIRELTSLDPTVGYELLALATDCAKRFDAANADVRTELLGLRTQLHPSSTETSTAILRRVGKLYCALDGRRAARLAALLGKQAGDDCAPIFESAIAAAATCPTSARLQVYNALIAPIRSTLAGLSKLEVWSAEAEGEEGGAVANLEFSVPPSEYVHGIAQGLLDVPSMVQVGSLSTTEAAALWEALADGADGGAKLGSVRMAGLVKAIDAEDAAGEDGGEGGAVEEEEEDAAYNWLVVVAKGTVAMLLSQLEGMGRLTERGSAQLGSDLSHFSKVLGAGEMEPGPVLLQVCTHMHCASTLTAWPPRCHGHRAVALGAASACDSHHPPLPPAQSVSLRPLPVKRVD